MIYILSGNRESVDEYIEENPNKFLVQMGQPAFAGVQITYCKSSKHFRRITAQDSIVLLPGWTGHKWAIEDFSDIIHKFPNIKITYKDGKFGEEVRKKMEEEIPVYGREEILDLRENI
jgi:hypothetical protein